MPGRNTVILGGGRSCICNRKDEIIHGLSPSVKCVLPLFRLDMSYITENSYHDNLIKARLEDSYTSQKMIQNVAFHSQLCFIYLTISNFEDCLIVYI